MAKKTFYVLGKTDEGGSLYNDESSYDRLKVFICDTVADLPESGMSETDFAIVLADAALYTVKDSAWIGGTSESWPVGSVIILVPDTNPAELLGYGTWKIVNQSVLPAYVWRRTE